MWGNAMAKDNERAAHGNDTDEDGSHHHDATFDRSTRRSILTALGIATVGSVATAAVAQARVLNARVLPGMTFAPTPGIDLVQDKIAHPLPRPLVATSNDILGPFWRAGAPFAADLVPKGAKGQKLVLSGRVLDTDGKPIPNVVMDFWNADADGKYDLENPFQLLMPDGYRFRGLVKTGADGSYSVETILPGKYRVPPKLPGFEEFDGLLRPAHVHLMTSHNGTVPLITQIYFEGDPELLKDPWGSKSRNVIAIDKSAETWRSRFDVILLRAGA
jgi:catechol 1,2-dioxygenase